jgi:hypothetical protein
MQPYIQKLVEKGVIEEDKEYFNIDVEEKSFWYRAKPFYCLILDADADQDCDLDDNALIYSIIEKYDEEDQFMCFEIMLSNLDTSISLEDIEDYITIFKKTKLKSI